MSRVKHSKKQSEEITIPLRYILSVFFVVTILVSKVLIHNQVELNIKDIDRLEKQKSEYEFNHSTTKRTYTEISNTKYLIEQARKLGFISTVSKDTIYVVMHK